MDQRLSPRVLPDGRHAIRASLRAWVKRHQLATYFILAYAVTWILLSPLVAQGFGLPTPHVSPIWHALGALGPAVSAFFSDRACRHTPGRPAAPGEHGALVGGDRLAASAPLTPLLLLGGSVVLLRVIGQPLAERDQSRLASPTHTGCWAS